MKSTTRGFHLLLAALVAFSSATTGLAGAAEEPSSAPASTAEPELKPGIPGLKMADVRDHNHLWRELEELQEWEVSNRITIADFRNKAIEKTGQYLGLEGEAAKTFATSSLAVVLGFRDASRASGKPERSVEESDQLYRQALESAESQMKGLLTDQPRHQVFQPKLRTWLLRLALGPDNREEDRESQTSSP